MLVGAIRAEVICFLSYSLHSPILRRSSAAPFLELRTCSPETRKQHQLLSYKTQVAFSRRHPPTATQYVLELCVFSSKCHMQIKCILLCAHESCADMISAASLHEASCVLCLKQHAGQTEHFCVFTHKSQSQTHKSTSQGCMKSSTAL